MILERFRWLQTKLQGRLTARARRKALQAGAPLPFFPYRPEAKSYILLRNAEPGIANGASPFAVPQPGVRLGYGDTDEEWLQHGRQDVDTMRRILDEHGFEIATARRILDFGCDTGRLIRWLSDLADTREIWGTDVNASAIVWCKQHLQPPFNFATTTLMPHLPFEDRFFDLIYTGSVFTHVDDLADAWFQELRRILRPGGMLYVTIHDQHTIALLKGRYNNHPLNRMFRRFPQYERYASSDFGMFTIGRQADSQVFYDVEYLTRSLSTSFAVRAVVEEAYWHQTALLLERL